MKRQILFLGLILGSLTLASCNKDWTCECTYYDSDGDQIGSNTYTIEDADADEAKSECESGSYGVSFASKECDIEVF